MKKCSNCNVEKEVTSFYKKKSSPDGLQNVCKICSYIIQKEYQQQKKSEEPKKRIVKRDGKFLNLMGIKEEDYCNMYLLLSKIGYNPEMDIYPQFAKRWGLKVSKTPRKGTANHWTYQDCKK
jgi:hypothetical protein